MSIIDQIGQDLGEVPVICTSRRGWGKTTLIKHLVKHLKDELGDNLIVKCFDPSFAWMESPLEWYQRVDVRKIKADKVDNIGDCVYLLDLGKDDRRAFVATIIKQDLEERKHINLKYGLDSLKGLPLIVYVIEEANQILDSTSLNKSDMAGEILSDFISIGRNWGLSGILLTTAVSGELSTKVRRRAEYLIGRLNSVEDIRLIKGLRGKEIAEQSKELTKYSFIYCDAPDQEISLGYVQSFSKPKRYARRVTFTEIGLKPLVAPKSCIPRENKPYDYRKVYEYTMRAIGLGVFTLFLILAF